MEQKDEKTLDLLVTAKWVDENGIEYEKNMQIDDITHRNSVSIELKTVESRFVLEETEPVMEVYPWRMDSTVWFGNNNGVEGYSEALAKKRMHTHYRCVMQTYWEYYEYQQQRVTDGQEL